MSNGERDPWYAYQDRRPKAYTQAELDAAVAAVRNTERAAERERCERKPLTEGQIDAMLGEANRGYCIERDDYIKAVRDAERAHGIGD